MVARLTMPRLVVAVVVSAAVAVSTPGSPAKSAVSRGSLSASIAQVNRSLAGIPQRRLVLGKPTAPIEIIEYAGFECGPCVAVHQRVVPKLIERYVRTGRATLEYRPLAATSRALSLTLGAFAASPQRRGWHMVQLEYLRTTADPATKPAPTETPTTYASAFRLDLARWKRDVGRREWALDLQAALTVFKTARWTQAPVFLLRRKGHAGAFVVLTAPTSLDAFVHAVAKARTAS
jgi:hypothetical protein